MGYLGKQPTAIPLSGSDIVDDSIESADIKAGTIVDSDVNASAAIATSKVSGAVTSIASHGLATSATTDTTNAANIGSGTLPDARFPATLPAASGVNLTALNATNLGSGTVPTARLGSGTASSSTFLRGDSTYAAAGGGKVLQVVSTNITTRPSTTVYDTSGTGGDLGLNVAITPTNSNSKFLINVSIGIGTSTGMSWGNGAWGIILVRDSTRIGAGVDVSNRNGIFMRSPSYSGDGNFGYTISFTYYNTTTGTGGSEIIFRANGISQETGTLYLNRSYTNEDDTGVYSSYTSASITVTEVDA